MQYTTIDNIARMLRGRLSIKVPDEQAYDPNLFSGNGYGPTAGSQAVDLETVEMVGRQEESRINLLLSQIYKMPLRLVDPTTVDILEDISTKYICSTIISVHFQGSSPNILATDISSAATDWRRSADFVLSQILASSNIFFPTSIQVPQVPQARPLVLPGEILLGQNDLPDIVDKNLTIVAPRIIKPTSLFFE